MSENMLPNLPNISAAVVDFIRCFPMDDCGRVHEYDGHDYLVYGADGVCRCVPVPMSTDYVLADSEWYLNFLYAGDKTRDDFVWAVYEDIAYSADRM